MLVPDSVTGIGDYAFGYTEQEDANGKKSHVSADDFALHGSSGSAAETYALANSIQWHRQSANGTVVQKATCTEAGKEAYLCTYSACGATCSTNGIDATGHKWTYSASGATLTAVCGNDSAHTVSVTISAPASLTYDGTKKAAYLLAQGKTSGKTAVRITWTKVSGADGYEVYGRKCDGGKKYKLLKSTKKTSYTQRNLKKTGNYKYYVKAYKKVDGKKVYLAQSATLHVAMKDAARTNAAKVKVTVK